MRVRLPRAPVASAVLLAATAAFAPARSGATTFYVRGCAGTETYCRDSNDGRSPETAWASLQHAANEINRAGNAGDVVIVGPGFYLEGDVDLRRSGIPAAPITFRGDPTGLSTGDPPGPVVIDAEQRHDTGFLVFGASDVVISGFHLTNAKDAGVQIRPNPSGKGADRAVVANNVVFGNGELGVGRGIEVVNATGVLIFNNLVYGNAATGISVGGVPGSPHARLINNTVYGHVFGVVVGERRDDTTGMRSACPGAWLVNNLIAASRVFGIDVNRFSTCDYVAAFNLVTDPAYSDTTPGDASDLHEDPLLVAPQQGNFALSSVRSGQQRTSPAIDAGAELATALDLAAASTQTNAMPDANRVDLGYHEGNDGWPAFPVLPVPPLTLFVRASGRDIDDGETPGQAKATVGAAVRAARANTRIVIGPGTYAEGEVGPAGLSPAGPIEIYADVSGALTGDPPGPVLIDASGYPTGIAVTGRCSTIIDSVFVTGSTDAGILIKEAHGSIVRNTVTFSNRRRGIQVVDADDVQILNNLAYANRSVVVTNGMPQTIGGGIQVGGFAGSRRTVIENNTLFDNGVTGILIGTGGVPSPGAQVRYNIMHGNDQNGIQLDRNDSAGVSGTGYCAAFNINTDGYGPILPAHCPTFRALHETCPSFAQGVCTLQPLSDRTLDPRFVRPAGRDGCVGGRRFGDDDFRLAQLAAGQSTQSPGVDFADRTADALGLGLRSTRTDAVVDQGPVDLGFHYPLVAMPASPPLPGDCNRDGRVAVDELVLGVSIMLGRADVAACATLDQDEVRGVSVAELVRAISESLC